MTNSEPNRPDVGKTSEQPNTQQKSDKDAFRKQWNDEIDAAVKNLENLKE